MQTRKYRIAVESMTWIYFITICLYSFNFQSEETAMN